MEEFMDQGLRDWVVAAASPTWSVRAAAGRRLASAPRIESVAGVLHQLLLDAHDTAVTSDTAVALLARRDLAGLRTVLAARAVAPDGGTCDQLAAELDGDPRWSTGQGGGELIAQLRALASDGDPAVRSEALLRLTRLR
ncbi:HEAT repeat domain-containing protein [Kitasatospora sp. P5_F3]